MEEYRIGDVVYSSGGYNRTDVYFYKVIGRTDKTLTIRPIESKVVDGDPMRVYYVVADESLPRVRHYTPKGSCKVVSDSNPFRVYLGKDGVACIRHSYEVEILHVWDGTPQWANTGYQFNN